MVSAPDRLTLVDATLAVSRLCGQPIAYSVIWRLIVQGDVPAERVRNRWTLCRADLPRIAAVLSGRAPPDSAEPRRAAA